MANEANRKKSELLDWQNEKKYQQKVIKSAKATAKEKEYAKKRVAEADTNIKRLKGAK